MTKWVNGLNIHLKALIYGLMFALVLVIGIVSISSAIYFIVTIPYHLGFIAFFIVCAYFLGYNFVKSQERGQHSELDSVKRNATKK